MSHPAHIQSFFDSKAPILLVVDEILNDWKGDGCLQFTILMPMVIAKMGWTGEEGDKLARANEPIIRDYVRNHADWYVTRGAHGGIMRASEKKKKDAVLEAKKKAKEEIKAAIEAKVAAKAAEAASAPATVSTDESDDGEDNTNTVSE